MSEQAVTFNADELMAEAIEQTGFDDFGEPFYREGFERLLSVYGDNIPDEAGRQRSRQRFLMLLATRLRCENAYKTIPEIAQQEIHEPLFVTGLPRSATSALINLLVAAPENRGILQWEVQFPDPWPDTKPGDEDPRYQYLVKALEKNSNSDFSKIHHVTATTPEECVLIHALTMGGVQMGFEIMMEPYRSWILEQDLKPLYEFQKRIMQMLNWRNPGEQWMLKAPAHMWAVNDIREVFPGAKFVWCHRDPRSIVPSISSMSRAVIGMYCEDMRNFDLKAIGRASMEWYAMSLEKGLAERAKLPEDAFIDCSQREFVDEPMTVVERVYGLLGKTLSDDSRAALEAHIADNPKGKHGKHEYSLEEFGLTQEMIDERFAFYTEDSRWPISD